MKQPAGGCNEHPNSDAQRVPPAGSGLPPTCQRRHSLPLGSQICGGGLQLAARALQVCLLGSPILLQLGHLPLQLLAPRHGLLLLLPHTVALLVGGMQLACSGQAGRQGAGRPRDAAWLRGPTAAKQVPASSEARE